MKFHEHDIVITTKRVRDDHQLIQAGSIGTIIHLHDLNPGRAQVEFDAAQIAIVPFSKMRREHTCVYCGCADSKACAGGCHWLELHDHAPTGVCSRCATMETLGVGVIMLRVTAPLPKKSGLFLQFHPELRNLRVTKR